MGHDPVVFSPNLGPVAEEIVQAGVRVVDRLESLAEAPVIIHGHHLVETTLATLRFPSTRAIFVCHDRFIWHDMAFRSQQIRRYAAVDRNCMERLIHECEIPSDIVRLIHNAVDTNRFRSRTELPHKPGRALIFSNYAGPGTHLEPILQTCSVLNIQADVVGSGMGVSSRAPEDVLPRYDLVFCECALRSGGLGGR